MSDSDAHTPLHFRKRSNTILKRADTEARRSREPEQAFEI